MKSTFPYRHGPPNPANNKAMALSPGSTWLQRAATLPFLGVIYVYRVTLGPFLGGHCRFFPTCSQYALDAYREHGTVRGSVLTTRRLCRCHPLGRGGYDPVPPRVDGQSPNPVVPADR
jgi:putative membrane protein insertion efficiency factor